MASFKAASAPKLPKIACVGQITDVAPTKASNSGKYNITNISIEPLGGGIKTTAMLLTRPDWLTPAFDPDIELEGNKSALFVYASNISGPSGSPISRLLGAAGSAERADALAAEIQAGATTTVDEDGNEVSIVPDNVLDNAFQKLVGTTVGYIMQQRREETDQVDENGKKKKILTNNYEFGEFFYPTDKALTKYRKLAEERPADWRVGFDGE